MYGYTVKSNTMKASVSSGIYLLNITNVLEV